MIENIVIHVFPEAITCCEGDTMSTLWRVDAFIDGTVRFKSGDKMVLPMTQQIEEKDVYEHYANKRVRIAWNPQVNLWFVWLIDDEDCENKRARFCVARLEIHTVGVFGDSKSPFAPEGSPSFIGTIAACSTLSDIKSKPLTAHPYAPSKLYVGPYEDDVEFTHGKRVLVNGLAMFCKLP